MKTKKVVNFKVNSNLSKVLKMSWSSVKQNNQASQQERRMHLSLLTSWRVNIPLIHKGEFAIHGIAGDKFSWLDFDLAVGLREGVGVHAADRNQAAKVGAVFVRLCLSFRAQLAGGPCAHVSRAVHSTVPLRLCWDIRSITWHQTGFIYSSKCSTMPIKTNSNGAWFPLLDFQVLKWKHKLTNYFKRNPKMR